MLNKYLPLGSVVKLKNDNHKYMIIGFMIKTNEQIYDYLCCLYPIGVIESNKSLLFNHDQIERILSVGFLDDTGINFNNEIQKDYKNFKKSEVSLNEVESLEIPVKNNDEKTNDFIEIPNRKESNDKN